MKKKRARETNNNNKFSSKSDWTLKIDPQGTLSPIGLVISPFFLSCRWLCYSIKNTSIFASRSSYSTTIWLRCQRFENLLGDEPLVGTRFAGICFKLKQVTLRYGNENSWLSEASSQKVNIWGWDFSSLELNANRECSTKNMLNITIDNTWML